MEVVILCAIGLVAGILGGLLGIGGSIVMIPAMTEFLGPQQHLYQAAAMIVNFFVVLPAAYQHHRARAVMGAVVWRMAPLAVVAVAIGVWASEWSAFRGAGQSRLMMLFGAFLVYVAGRNVMQLVRRVHPRGDGRPPFDPQRDRLKAGLIAGLPTGFIAGLLGVGGGIVCVPLQSRYLNVPLRNAIANSTATIIALSLIGACLKNAALTVQHPEYALSESLRLALLLIPTAMIGALIGSRLTHALPLRALHLVFGVFLFVAGGRMMWHGYEGIRTAAAPSAPAAHFVAAPTRSTD